MEGKIQKSYFEVLGVCCPSETPLIHRILKPLEGVQKVSVNVPTKTVIVVHNNLLISQAQIVKVLNQARLDASVRSYGGRSGKTKTRNWPSLYTVGSGLLLTASFFKTLYRPLLWLALAAVVVGLPPVILRSYAAIRRLVLDINILLLIAVGGAVALRDYQEAGMIVFLFTFAEWLESRASDKARDMMSSLMKEMPQKATIAESGAVVHPNEVKVNTVLVVKAGEVIPIDGVVVNGKSEVDEKSLTGESFPVEKTVGSFVWAGTMNLTGYIDVKTTAVAEESAVAKMAKLVEEAHQKRSRTQRMIEEFAKYYSPIVVIASVGVAVVPAMLRVDDLHHWLYLSLVVLVSACPCALVLSTPVATECALRRAASIGILVKGGHHLESLARVKVMAFDKTGTLTRGKFSVSYFYPNSRVVSGEKLLYWVASMEGKSNHPMASALVEYSRLNNIEASSDTVKDFVVVPGEGISGDIDGNKISIGNRRMANRLGCEVAAEGEDEKRRGTTMGYVVVNGVVAATFGVCDECRPGSNQVIQELKRMGIKTAMLTGDSKISAMHLQQQVGNSIDFVHAELLPEGKVSTIEDLKKLGLTVMVGDGMNDAPALATASVGIAMGVSGSAIATETSHVTLMSNDIGKIAVAIKLGRRTNRKIIENIVLSVTTKAAILGLAFAGHPLLWAAVLADVGTCVLVILNSMLLLLQQQQEHNPGAGGHGSHEGCSPCGDRDKHHHKSVWSRLPCGSRSAHKSACVSHDEGHGHHHLHENASLCRGHKVESPCKHTSLGLSMEEYGHMGCRGNCLPHMQHCEHEDHLPTRVTHDHDSTPHFATCHQRCEDNCAKACTEVAICLHPHTDIIPQTHTCETTYEQKHQESCYHTVTCGGTHEGDCKHASGHACAHQHSHTVSDIGEGEIRVQVEDRESVGQGEPSCGRGELTLMNHDAFELHGSTETEYGDKDMRGAGRCCRSFCRPSEGVCIHGRPFLSEIVIE
ncbi:putative inactive cadmium/zinc-transporting ATPase HMA3 isoform X2 [Nymphaea colorata]|nr:putative inactive cadmium/zinc-transporting ATPase HMA3 isoform X2 [Nymphaea colorata]XP_031474774.1 putative inactive cadmium/zinc-transporting ATPase HMA3 isoform X2 [Nymphaea colorata]XP_031474775.1 putative inactive cadmium/zinc-transporting ATPase HMA3 isoform X2 [Nymphaea colorata]XP_031474777.1 putative inactive cadmium/zinc-transporting ATPase HMA3 isoform X2 [Nymphaea colorata]XP_031474778.1 putative inactive cadmium/zinc-transporting ATPase HMA3 isoform X2 [Nymphaea colorata]